MTPARPRDEVLTGLGGAVRPGPRRVGGVAGDLFLGGFGAVFVAAGVALLVFVAPEALRGGSLQERLGILLIGLFPVVGFGLIVLTVRGRAERRRKEALRARHPDEPWMWRPEWARGEIRGSAQATAVFAWCFALVWNAISWPMLPKLLDEIGGGNHAALLGMLFPAVGLGLLGWAVLATLRARRFGVAVLTLDTRPGRIGGRFAGQIDTGRPLPADAGAALRLACVRRTTIGTGKSRRTHETVLWEGKSELAAGQLGRGVRGTRIPAAFEIPEAPPPSDDSRPDDTVLWRLEVRAELPGPDFLTHFEVPVFRER